MFVIFSFSDRGKRLKLQQFLVKKADTLYCKSNLIRTADPIKQEPGDEGNNFLDIIFGYQKYFLLPKCKISYFHFTFRILCYNAGFGFICSHGKIPTNT